MDCCIASNVLQINQNKKKEMLIYSIAECTFVVVFSPTQWRNASQSPACWATYAVILNLARQKYRKAKSPNEENSSRLVMNVSGLETSKKLSNLAFVSKCQDFYTKALDDILYIFPSFPKRPK